MRFVAGALLAIACCVFAQSPDYRINGNIHYARSDATVLDILQPRAPALRDRPAVLFLHGGGWTGGTKEEAAEVFCLPFVEHGFVVANADYHLETAGPKPAAVTDVLLAARWLVEHAEDSRIDPKKIVVSGFSAGGHLALLAAMLPAGNDFGPVTRFAAVVNFAGIADVADLLAGPHQRDYAVNWIPEMPARMDLAKRLSPITYVRKGLPPVLTIHGDADPTVPHEQSERLTAALNQADDQADLITLKGAAHGLDKKMAAGVYPGIFKWLKKRHIE